MLRHVRLQNYGPLKEIDWHKLGPINLVIGNNGSGKTFLLKALYTAIKTIEEYGRGDDKRSASEILSEKLYWTFQPERIGDLVNYDSRQSLDFGASFEEGELEYRFGRTTEKQIKLFRSDLPNRNVNSVFLPAKEMLSLQHVILRSREEFKEFGFDDTYFDLARALRPRKGARIIPGDIIEASRGLDSIMRGSFIYNNETGKWIFTTYDGEFSVGVTAEGVKKAAILSELISVGYIRTGSIIFIDEPESALHPEAISTFMDVIEILAGAGFQFFIASHSYFVVKKLFLIAQRDKKRKLSIPVLSLSGFQPTYSDLKEEMPNNEIIAESIRLYKQEMSL